jgi:hypothetical protein
VGGQGELEDADAQVSKGGQSGGLASDARASTKEESGVGYEALTFALGRYGEIGVFYGNQCQHETVRNETEVTRCSFDFRIIPGSFFEPDYYDKNGSFSWKSGYWNKLALQ